MINNIKTYLDHHNAYLDGGREQIADINLKMLYQLSAAAVVIIGSVLLLTTIIFPTWRITPFHIVLLIGSLVIFGLTNYVMRLPRQRVEVITLLCQVFIIFLMIMVSVIDIYHEIDSPSTFTPVLLIAVPCLFVFRFRLIYGEIFVWEVCYCLAESHFKVLGIAQTDIFTSIFAVMLAVVVSIMMHGLRSESFLAENRYRQLSMVDGLTGILNKSNCETAVQAYLAQRSPAETCALLMMDVDDFKLINDKMGHSAGDVVLQEVGQSLTSIFRSSDILGRFGGDEFIIFMRNVPNEVLVQNKCEQIKEDVEKIGLRIGRSITISIGVAMVFGQSTDYLTLFELADHCLYEAKALGKNRYIMHNLSMAGVRQPRLLLVDDDDISRTALKSILESDYDVIDVDNGQTAINIIQHSHSDLDMVLLDLVMPRIDGKDVLNFMKQNDITDLPVLVVSVESKKESEMLAMGVTDMISKPFDVDVVRFRVRNALQNEFYRRRVQALEQVQSGQRVHHMMSDDMD